MNNWSDEYFDRAYLMRWRLGLPDQRVRDETAFLRTQLGIAPGRVMLDVACGQGRYALAFASPALHVTGLDRSSVLLREGRRLAQGSGLNVHWVHADIRAIPFRSSFDCATFLDAFGFFETPAEDQHALAEIVRALRPEGLLTVAIANASPIVTRFRSEDHEQWNGERVTISRELIDDGHVVREHLTLGKDGAVSTFERNQRIYTANELKPIMEQSGLVVTATYGGLLGSDFDPQDSAKIVMVGRKVNATVQ